MAGDDAIFAGAGSDVYSGGTGLDTAVYYRSFYDIFITITATGYSIVEPNGLDTLTEFERIAADEGVFEWNVALQRWDQISTTAGLLLIEPTNQLLGTAGDDTMSLAGSGKSNAFALAGDDRVTGTGGWDTIFGGDGNDTLKGETAQNATTSGNDRLHGEAGDDILLGGGSSDLLYGGAGNDRLAGGNGGDYLTGGIGADVFVFRYATDPATAETWGADTVNDFQLGIDHIALEFGAWDANGAPTNLTPFLNLTSAGWSLSLPGAGSALLKGLFTPGLTLADLTI